MLVRCVSRAGAAASCAALMLLSAPEAGAQLRCFGERVLDGEAEGARRVITGAIDGDSDIDVVLASDEGLAWYESDGGDPPGFTEHVLDADAEFVADRLLRLIGEPVTLGSQKVYPTASIGIAFAADDDVADLFRRADTAMYRAKAQGRAQHAAFDEVLQQEVTTRMATEAGLRDALRNGEFLVHYQPEISTIDGRMLGAEALVRWDHPEKGVLPAGAFIEVAEETGLVVDMGEFVLAEAGAQAASWPGGDDGPIIRVNLAAAQLQRDDPVALVRFVLHESGLPPHRLCLEITESAVMADINRTEQILDRLKEELDALIKKA